jgi:CRP/FNR family transcriptional regulator
MLTYSDFLKKVSLFSELDDEELQQIATVVREQHYKKHITIVHVDDPGNALYILKSGLVTRLLR